MFCNEDVCNDIDIRWRTTNPEHSLVGRPVLRREGDQAARTVVLGARKGDMVGDLEVEEEEVVERLTPYQEAAAGDVTKRGSRIQPMERRSLR